MHIIASPDHALHDPPFEIIDGQITPYYEMPRRVAIIRAALEAAGFSTPQPPRSFGVEPLLAVHLPAYLAYLERAYSEWVGAGKPPEALLPSAWPLGSMRSRSGSVVGEAGRYCFDLSAPIVAGTYAAARASADCALTGADLLLNGAQAAYALCRPPGHHAMPALAGGYCYLNNAAIAANYLACTGEAFAHPSDPPHEASSRANALPLHVHWAIDTSAVALLDIDFHHGNGSQAIFYERSDVFFASIHGDPDREYPYFAGFADERGSGVGEGYNLNIPLAAGISDQGYLRALEQATSAIADYRPRYLVVSAGLDTFGGDPLGDFGVTTEGFGLIGQQIAALGLPTLFVQEGGYAIDELGKNLVTLLQGFMREQNT